MGSGRSRTRRGVRCDAARLVGLAQDLPAASPPWPCADARRAYHGCVQVFISSVQRDYADVRKAVRRAVESLGMRPLMAELAGARPESPQRALLDLVARADVFLLLVGPRYSKPTEDEFDEARRRGKTILVLRQNGDLEPEQQQFLERVAGGWSGGRSGARSTVPATFPWPPCRRCRMPLRAPRPRSSRRAPRSGPPRWPTETRPRGATARSPGSPLRRCSPNRCSMRSRSTNLASTMSLPTLYARTGSSQRRHQGRDHARGHHRHRRRLVLEHAAGHCRRRRWGCHV